MNEDNLKQVKKGQKSYLKEMMDLQQVIIFILQQTLVSIMDF